MIVGRVLQRLGSRLAGGIYRRRGLIAVGALLIAGVIVVGSLNLFPTNLLPSAPPSAGGLYQGGSDGEPRATADYIRGQQTYDARLVWDAYSDRMLRSFAQQNVTIEDFQRRLERAKSQGSEIKQVRFIGSTPIPNGQMAFYVIARAGQRGVAYVPYTFTLDGTGKIDNVE